jgi:YHS domain-containing protein
MNLKKIIVSTMLVVILGPLLAQSSQVFTTDAGAIKGYDPVAFFKVGKPVMGLKEYSYDWNKAKWYFSSSDNLMAFKKDPEKFAPQYGGYCAYGTSEGHKVPTETDTWTIVNNMLYFNYNKNVQTKWKADQKNRIEQADKTWPSLKDK